jgi:hypothetical protein
MSQELPNVLDTGAGIPRYRQGSTVSLTSPTGQAPSWQSSANVPLSSFTSSAKGKQPITGESAIGQSFLVPLFDRDDFLLTRTEIEEDNADDDTVDENIDPQLTRQVSNFDIGRLPQSYPRQSSRSQRPSPHRQRTVRSIYPTHLAGRQPIANTIMIHRNLDLRNLFGTSPFSSGIQSHHFPADVTDTKVGNLFVPTWAMLPMTTLPDPGSLGRATPGVLQEAANMINMGVPIEQVIETHPNIAALYDENVFNSSGLLSKWAVGMVHGVFLKGSDLFSKHTRSHS